MKNRVTFGVITVGLALSSIGCTGPDSNETSSDPTSRPSDSTETSDPSTSDPSTSDPFGDAENPGSTADDNTGSQGEPSAEVEVVLTEEEGISEEPAQEPVIADDEVVELEFEEASEAAQAKVGVSESALCATLQIGRDAVADGNDDLADRQRDLVIERTPGVSDGELAAILAEVAADQPLDISIADNGLKRCQTLGFEL